jgi:hypothetical protein
LLFGWVEARCATRGREKNPAARRKLVKFHQINVNPRSLTFSPDESKVYFGSFWVDGFFEMDAESGEVTRLAQS